MKRNGLLNSESKILRCKEKVAETLIVTDHCFKTSAEEVLCIKEREIPEAQRTELCQTGCESEPWMCVCLADT